MATREDKKMQEWGTPRLGRAIIGHLAGALYEKPIHCVFELVKNAAVACMPDRQWDLTALRKAPIELSFINHPIAPGCTSLVVLDHGTGFTQDNIARFLNIGGDGDDTSSHSGASQKRLGRLAAFSLSNPEGKYPARFFLFTRTGSAGDVSLVKLVQDQFSGNPIRAEQISPTSSLVGPESLRGKLIGSFSMFVIPDIMLTEVELRHGLEALLPRKKSLEIPILLNGKRLNAPTLASRSKTDCGVDIHLDRTPKGVMGGVWLTDATTGIRCAFAPVLDSHLPYPFSSPGLIGDVFLEGLLSNQGTSRSGLRQEFLRSAKWRKIVDTLRLHGVEFAQNVLGDSDVFKGDEDDKIVDELIEACTGVWGPPQINGGNEPTRGGGNRPPKSKPEGGGGTSGGGGGSGSNPAPPGPGNEPGKTRSKALCIDGESYWLSRSPLGPDLYADIQAARTIKQPTLYINPLEYAGFPLKGGAAAKMEHAFLQILAAIATHRFGDDMDKIRRWTGEMLRKRNGR